MDYYCIGDEELVTGFAFVGVRGESPRSHAELEEAFRRVTSGKGLCTVLILTEDASDALGEELSDWQLSGQYPLVVELPGIGGRTEGRKTLVDAIREAIGIHV